LLIVGVIMYVIWMFRDPVAAANATSYVFHQLGIFFGTIFDWIFPEAPAYAEPVPPASTPTGDPTVYVSPEPAPTKTVYVYPDGHREEGF
jgi:hypothetical protein